MAEVCYFNDYTPGIKEYTTRRPATRMEARRACRGKYYYIDTIEEIKRVRGVVYRKTYTAEDLTQAERHKKGWSSYLVSAWVFKALAEKHPIAMKI